MGETGRSAGSPRSHHAWHGSLLCELPPHRSPRPRVDGVVVPTHRDAGHLSFAVSVAREFGCPLLAISGGDSRPSEVLAKAEGVRCYVVRDTDALRLSRLPTAITEVYVPSDKQRNIAAGRNLGLLVARLAGWQTILFLDDDVDVDPQERSRFGAAVARFSHARVDAAGWVQWWFQDNSVVCHANRLAGNSQYCFISTGALLVNVSERTAFFPPVYNEDWLFLFDWLARRRVARAGQVRQKRYNPYEDPSRAADEEFGDVLAEGLFHLLHSERPAEVTARLSARMSDPSHWERELAFRGTFLTGVAAQLRSGGVAEAHAHLVPDALASVAAAVDRLEGITPGDLVSFVAAWQDDLKAWQDTLHRLHPIGTTPAAFDVLHIPYATTVDD